MKKIVSILIFLIVSLSTFSQGTTEMVGGGGKPKGGPSAGQGGSQGKGGSQAGIGTPANPAQQGYVYRLRKKHIIYYRSGKNGKMDTEYVYSKTRKRISITQDSGKLIINIFSKIVVDNIKKTPGEVFDQALNKKAKTPRLIQPGDSAANFFLLIKQRNTVGDNIYSLKIPYTFWQFGALTIPFKIRFGFKSKDDTAQNDASTSININFYAAKVWGHTRFFCDPGYTDNPVTFMLGGFFGPSVLALAQNNTSNPKLVGTNQPGISTGLFIAASLQNFNFGLFGGMDIPVGGDAYTWYYSYKPWLGIGIGFNLGMFNSQNTQTPLIVTY